MKEQTRLNEFSGPSPEVDDVFRQRKLDEDLVDLSLIWRVRNRIAIASLVGGILTAVVLSQVTPTYRADSQILVEPRETVLIDIENTMSENTINDSSMLSEAAVFRTAPVIYEVVRQLELQNDPEFNPQLRSVNPVRKVIRFVRSIYSSPKEQGEVDPIGLAAYEVSKNIDVQVMGETYIIRVSAWSESPDRAAQIANTLPQVYINNQINDKFVNSERISAWLEQKVDEIREELILAEQKVEDFKVKAALEGRSTPKLLERQAEEISVQLIEARNSYTSLESRYNQYQRLIAERNFLAASELSTSPVIEGYRRRHANVSTEIEETQLRFGDDNSATKRLIAIRDEIERSIHNEIENIGSGILAAMEIAEAQVKAMTEELKKAESALAEQSVHQIALRELVREADAMRAVYQQFLVRLKETRERGGFQEADARILSYASVPGSPVEPRIALMSVIIAVVFGILALVGSILMTKWRSTLLSEDDVRRCCNLPVLANLPKAEGPADPLEVSQWMRSRPYSSLAEAVRWLRIAVDRTTPQRPRTILITSAVLNEGKTTTSLMFAQASALGGERALLVDADVRRQTASSLFDMGDTNFQMDDERGFDVLRLNQPMGDRAFAFKSSEFLEKITAANRKYQTIVIDAPPAFCLSEIAGMVQTADAVLLACKWNSTPAGAVEQTVRNLLALGANVKGVVLTVVDLKRQADMTFHSASYALQQAMRSYSGEVSVEPEAGPRVKSALDAERDRGSDGEPHDALESQSASDGRSASAGPKAHVPAD